MINGRFCAALLGLIFAAGTAGAGIVGYECTVRPSGSNFWLPEILFIGHNRDDGGVFVSDPIILHYNNKQPVAGRVKTDNARRITFAWSLKVRDSSGQSATINYTATYLKASGEVSMNALPLGYADVFTARGACEVKPIK